MDMLIRINTEREHLFSPDIHVGITAGISKVIEAGRIRAALKAMCFKHPLLASAIVFDENNVAFYKLNSSKPILIEFSENSCNESWQQWITRSNHKPFDFEKGPLMRIRVAYSAGATTITALGHHMLGDGLSFYFFMRDLLNALDGKTDGAQLLPPIIQDASALPKAARPGFLGRLLAKSLNRNYRRSGKRFSYGDYSALYQDYNFNKKPALSTFFLSPDETATVIFNCRRHNVTVNEAVSTAFFAARREAGIQSSYLGVSCNIRKEMVADPLDSMGNYVSGVFIQADYDDSLDFWANAGKTGGQLKAKLKDDHTRLIVLGLLDALDDTLLDAVNFAGSGGYRNKTAQKLCGILCGVPSEGLGVSNLGRQTAIYEHFSLEEMYFIPPLFASNDFIAGVITVNNAMYFCLRYAEADLDPASVSALFGRAKALLLGN